MYCFVLYDMVKPNHNIFQFEAKQAQQNTFEHKTVPVGTV